MTSSIKINNNIVYQAKLVATILLWCSAVRENFGGFTPEPGVCVCVCVCVWVGGGGGVGEVGKKASLKSCQKSCAGKSRAKRVVPKNRDK